MTQVNPIYISSCSMCDPAKWERVKLAAFEYKCSNCGRKGTFILKLKEGEKSNA